METQRDVSASPDGRNVYASAQDEILISQRFPDRCHVFLSLHVGLDEESVSN